MFLYLLYSLDVIPETLNGWFWNNFHQCHSGVGSWSSSRCHARSRPLTCLFWFCPSNNFIKTGHCDVMGNLRVKGPSFWCQFKGDLAVCPLFPVLVLWLLIWSSVGPYQSPYLCLTLSWVRRFPQIPPTILQYVSVAFVSRPKGSFLTGSY